MKQTSSFKEMDEYEEEVKTNMVMKRIGNSRSPFDVEINEEDLKRENDSDSYWKRELDRKRKEMLKENWLDEKSGSSFEVGMVDLEKDEHEHFKPDIHHRQLTNALFQNHSLKRK